LTKLTLNDLDRSSFIDYVSQANKGKNSFMAGRNNDRSIDKSQDKSFDKSVDKGYSYRDKNISPIK